MIDKILEAAPLIKTLYVRSNKNVGPYGKLKNGNKVVQLESYQRSKSEPKNEGTE